MQTAWTYVMHETDFIKHILYLNHDVLTVFTRNLGLSIMPISIHLHNNNVTHYVR